MMENPVKSIFSDAKYCQEELQRIREGWGSTVTFTPVFVEAAQKTLGFMYVYCPESFQDSVVAVIDELQRRQILAISYGFPAFSSSKEERTKGGDAYERSM
jgi:hypothetical protein